MDKNLDKATLKDIDEARTLLLLIRERLNLGEDYHLAGEISAILIILDEMDNYIFIRMVNG